MSMIEEFESQIESAARRKLFGPQEEVMGCGMGSGNLRLTKTTEMTFRGGAKVSPQAEMVKRREGEAAMRAAAKL